MFFFEFSVIMSKKFYYMGRLTLKQPWLLPNCLCACTQVV